MSLYWLINLLSISIPFVVSFHPRIQLYKKWGGLFLAIFIAMVPYIIWDILFTESGYWGFNSVYLSGLYIFSLPIEEWFFFITIPYACVFTHYVLIELSPNTKLSSKWVNYITLFLFIGMAIMAILFHSKWYTLIDMIFGLIVLGLVYYFNKALLHRYFITFIFMLIPFFIVNGVLTGTGIENEIVWYNNLENLGIRIATIPIEDSVYAFSLVLLNLFLFELFSAKGKPAISQDS